MHSSPLAVAAVIKSQIGVWALAEVGARGFMRDDDTLYFDAKPLHRIVRVSVTLDMSDTYVVKVQNKKTGNIVYEVEGIYNDMLAGVIRNLAKELA